MPGKSEQSNDGYQRFEAEFDREQSLLVFLTETFRIHHCTLGRVPVEEYYFWNGKYRKRLC